MIPYDMHKLVAVKVNSTWSALNFHRPIQASLCKKEKKKKSSEFPQIPVKWTSFSYFFETSRISPNKSRLNHSCWTWLVGWIYSVT
jgi:hypothetical protein